MVSDGDLQDFRGTLDMGLRSFNNTVSSFKDPYSYTGTMWEAPTPPPNWYGDRAVIANGYVTSNVNTMQYYDITTTGNAADFGDMVISTRGGSGLSNGDRGCAGGGYSDHYDDDIQYWAFGTLGNASDFGNLRAGSQWAAAVSDGVTGCWAGRVESTNIDYVTIATTGDARGEG